MLSFLVVIVHVAISTWSIIEILSWFGKQINIILALIVGVFLGGFTIPVAVVGWILKLCGVFRGNLT